MKLTKSQTKLHQEAVARLDAPSFDSTHEPDIEFIREHWQEGATNLNTAAGAFFTPWSLALDASLNVMNSNDPNAPPVRVIDLCAGSGALAQAVWLRQTHQRFNGVKPVEIVCVELNPEYVELGRKLVPQATWVQASVFNMPDLGHFDVAVSNPPFGNIKRDGPSPRYTGAEFDLHVVDIAGDIADHGVFILPQMSCPFVCSGSNHYQLRQSSKYDRFHKQTGIELEIGLAIDASHYKSEWHGVAPVVEVAVADFRGLERERKPEPQFVVKPGPEAAPPFRVEPVELFELEVPA